MRRKLASWKRRHISFGGRICLVKSILSSFFFKIPKKVVSILNGLQINFCGALRGRRKRCQKDQMGDYMFT